MDLMINQHYISSRLKGIVECIIEFRADEPKRYNYFLGWQAEVLFRIGPEFEVRMKCDKSSVGGDDFSILTGVKSQPTLVSFERIHYVCVVFNPLAIKALFGLPVNILNNTAIGSEDIISGLEEIEEKLNSFSNFHERALYLEELFLKRINETAELHQIINLSYFLKKLSENNYNRSTKEVEKMFGYSKAQSFRLFNDWFGLSIGKFQKLMRFMNSLNQLHYSQESLTEFSHRLGYYDQAHYTRTFKEYTKLTPKEYKKFQIDSNGQLRILDGSLFTFRVNYLPESFF